MKKTITQICSLVGLVIVLMVSAQAQISTQYRAHIPFDFSVGNLNFPAGDYDIGLANSSINQTTLILRQKQSGKAKFVSIIQRETSEKLDVSNLVFNRYENQYFLAKMITPTLGGEFRQAKPEENLAKNQTPKLETVAIK